MDRKEFLTSIGFSAASVFVASCIGGCSKNTVPAAPTGVNMTLTLASYPALATVGGEIYIDGIVVAYAISGSYIAVSQYCTHQGGTVAYNSGADEFICPRHGACYSETGANVTGPATTPLTQYLVTNNGNGTITIKSK